MQRGIDSVELVQMTQIFGSVVKASEYSCCCNGGILSSDTTALDLTTEPITVCEGMQDTDSECTTTIQFGFTAGGIGDSDFYSAAAAYT
jgi:hypothetical protein